MSEGLLSKAGAVEAPSEYATLAMVRQFTGMWTHAGPFSDPGVPYLYGKFYGASRIDRIIDGINREINDRLDDARRPGNAVYNANTFPAAYSFAGWKYNQNAVEVCRVLEDGQDGTIYDATAGQKSSLFTKSSASLQARMLGVDTTLFLGDGVDQKKVLQTATTWQASTNVLPGTLINQGARPGVVYMALGGMTLPIIASRITGGTPTWHHTLWLDPAQVPENFANLVGAEVTFSNLATDTFLNGVTAPVASIQSVTLGIFTVNTGSGSAQAFTAEATGSGTTGNGTTAGTIPTFTATRLAVTADAGQQWKSYGTALQNWGLAAPAVAPTLTPLGNTRWWRLFTQFFQYYSIQDSNGNIQVATLNSVLTGRTYPTWADFIPSATALAVPGGSLAQTVDGQQIWYNLGVPGTWQASQPNAGQVGYVLLDSNQNLQMLQVPGTSGGSAPTWATTYGAPTTDGGATWLCISEGGAGVPLTFNNVQYAWSHHGVDGTVSTASAPALIQGPILGLPVPPGTVGDLSVSAIIASGIAPDLQTDQIYIWRTAQGQPTLIFEDAVPVDNLTTSFDYQELGIPDSPNGDSGSLNALIPAPVDETADPPPVGFLPCCYAQGRIWGVLNNQAVWSAGPDAVTGNGLTQFPPLNTAAGLGKAYAIFPITLNGGENANGAQVVFTSSGIQIILGNGSAASPFVMTTYFANVNVSGFNAVSFFNQAFFVMEANRKLSAVAVEYPFNPATGYTEVGFPIGDQLVKVTTGGLNAALFNPATAFVTWNNQSTSENALYVSDAAGHWFRMSPVAPPESGFLWSPVASIAGGASTVQSIETAPGVFNLLLAPAAGGTGPLLARDTTGTIFQDNGTSYPAWDVKGSIVLASSGEDAEVAHVALKSAAVGGRPAVSVLLGEIATTATKPFVALLRSDNDPPLLDPSGSYFSDRYKIQGGQTELCDTMQLKVDYGVQNAADELYMFSIYGAKHAERKQQ